MLSCAFEGTPDDSVDSFETCVQNFRENAWGGRMNRLALALNPLQNTTPVAHAPARQGVAGNTDSVLVTLRDVHLSYGEVPVLKGIDLCVRRGEAVSIIGPSGSGKSTLLRVINGLIAPQQGEVLVDGIDVRAQRTDAQKIALRKRIGFVFQQYNLFPHLSVLANLTIAPMSVLGRSRAEPEHDAHALLANVRMPDKANADPGELSGGQQQPVAIARTLAMRPAPILFGAGTAPLDPETAG